MLKYMSRRKFIGTSLGAAAGMGLFQSSSGALGAGRASFDADEGTKDKTIGQSNSEKRRQLKCCM
jgi:hypothetical protein